VLKNAYGTAEKRKWATLTIKKWADTTRFQYRDKTKIGNCKCANLRYLSLVAYFQGCQPLNPMQDVQMILTSTSIMGYSFTPIAVTVTKAANNKTLNHARRPRFPSAISRIHRSLLPL